MPSASEKAAPSPPSPFLTHRNIRDGPSKFNIRLWDIHVSGADVIGIQHAEVGDPAHRQMLWPLRLTKYPRAALRPLLIGVQFVPVLADGLPFPVLVHLARVRRNGVPGRSPPFSPSVPARALSGVTPEPERHRMRSPR